MPSWRQPVPTRGSHPSGLDVGPGERFDVRSAGNTAFNACIASLDDAVAQLQVPGDALSLAIVI